MKNIVSLGWTYLMMTSYAFAHVIDGGCRGDDNCVSVAEPTGSLLLLTFGLALITLHFLTRKSAKGSA